MLAQIERSSQESTAMAMNSAAREHFYLLRL